MSNENTVWLCNYHDRHFINIYGLRATFPEYSDAVLLNNLKQKKQSKQATNQELADYEQERDNGLKINDMWFSGQYIEEKNMPTKAYLEPNEILPKADEVAFQIINGYLVINKTCYEIMSQFNLGKTHFSNIEVLDMRTDKKVMEKEHYFINIAETREYLDIENSQGIKASNLLPEHVPERYIQNPKNGDIQLDNVTLNNNIDLWHDPRLFNSLFLSDRLVQALFNAGVKQTDLALVRCEINQ